MSLPFRIEIELTNPMIGKIIAVMTETEVGVDVDEGWFWLQD